MLRVDGKIDRTPTGMGLYQRYILTRPDKTEEAFYYPNDPGLDMAYFSVEELKPSHKRALHKKIEEAYSNSATSITLAKTFADYLNQLAKVAVTVGTLDKINQQSDDPTHRYEVETVLKDAAFKGTYSFQCELGKDMAYRHAMEEMQRLFPHAKELAQAVTASEEYPYISVNQQKLEDYFDQHISWEKGLKPLVDQTAAALHQECASHKLSATSRRMVDKVKHFPEQVRDKLLQPIFKLPFTDDSLVMRISPGTLIADWHPSVTMRTDGGSYIPKLNMITIPATENREGKVAMAELLGHSKMPDCFGSLPALQVNIESHTLRTIYFEEIFHYAMNAVFHNSCQPYHAHDTQANQQHMDAILADITLDGKTPNPEIVKKLDLEAYMDNFIAFRQHLEEGVRGGSSKNITAEIIAKVARLVEDDGWEATRTLLPHLCEDFEKRILPQCYKLCVSEGIDVPHGKSSSHLHTIEGTTHTGRKR